MGIFKKSKKELTPPVVRPPLSPEALEQQFGPDWEKAKTDLQKEILNLFPQVLRPEKKIYADEVAFKQWSALMLQENPQVPEEVGKYFGYFFNEHYESSKNDFDRFQSWCRDWIEQSDMPTNMWKSFSKTNQMLIQFMSDRVFSAFKKRLSEYEIVEGVFPSPEELANSREERIREFQEAFRYDLLDNLDLILKEYPGFQGKEVLPPLMFNLPDTLVSRLISKPLVTMYDQNFERRNGNLGEFWGGDYSLYFVIFVCSWLLSEQRIQCELKIENWVRRMSPEVRDAWFIDV